MSYWDDFESDWAESKEESKLLEKFSHYVDLQREHTKREETVENKVPEFLKSQSTVIAIIEGAILSGLAIAFAIMITI